ncbi:MAG: DUF6142 family protein [Lachnospiraceae bacterium]
MIQRKKPKNRAKFSGRKQSVRGCIGFAVEALALAGLLVLLNLAFVQKGNAGELLGSFGILDMIVAMAGLVLEILSLKEEDVYKMIPGIGTFLGVLTTLSWIGILVIGIFF